MVTQDKINTLNIAHQLHSISSKKLMNNLHLGSVCDAELYKNTLTNKALELYYDINTFTNNDNFYLVKFTINLDDVLLNSNNTISINVMINDVINSVVYDGNKEQFYTYFVNLINNSNTQVSSFFVGNDLYVYNNLFTPTFANSYITYTNLLGEFVTIEETEVIDYSIFFNNLNCLTVENTNYLTNYLTTKI